MSRYCIYESRRNNVQCVVRGQCTPCAAYQCGAFTPHFKVPALADTAMVLCLTVGAYNRIGERVVWDGVWRESVPEYVPFVCPR